MGSSTSKNLQHKEGQVATLALESIDPASDASVARLGTNWAPQPRQAYLPATVYEIVARWEERRGSQVRRTIISKRLTVSSVPDGTGYLVTLVAEPPTLRQPELTTLEEIVVVLAALYQRLMLRVSPTGQLLALMNHADIVRTWAAIKQQLAANSGGEEDELTTQLLTAVGKQVQSAEALLASLQYDYVYGFFFKPMSQFSAFGSHKPVSTHAFPHFFADTTLWFHEQPVANPPLATAGGLCLRGRLAEPHTDRAAVARQVAVALAPDADPTPPPPEPHSLEFSYSATYTLNAITGWPASIEAVVTCSSQDGYAKEYDLTIEQL